MVKIYKKELTYFYLIIFFFFLFLFFKVADIAFTRGKSVNLNYENEVAGKVDEIKKSRGNVIFKTIKSETYWFVKKSRNYNYEEYELCSFLKPNDSIFKKLNSDSLFIKRGQEYYYFVIGDMSLNLK